MIIFVIVTLYDTMISYEEYERRVNSPITDKDEDIRIIPVPVVVVIIVLSSLIGIFIVCEAIFGL